MVEAAGRFSMIGSPLIVMPLASASSRVGVTGGPDCVEELARGQAKNIALALERLLVRVHGIGHVDGKNELDIDVCLGGLSGCRLRHALARSREAAAPGQQSSKGAARP